MQKITSFVVGLGLILFSNEASALTKVPAFPNNAFEEVRKSYLTEKPIEESQAFNNFKYSPQTERAKLDYLVDRIRESKKATFYYGGNQYGWTDAARAGDWLVWRRYKQGEDARSFLKREMSYTPNKPAFVQPIDGPKCTVYEALMNELELLEQLLQKPKVLTNFTELPHTA